MVRRILMAVAAGAALTLGLAGPAIAHAELTATNPADGATVTQPLSEITLTFGEAVRGDGITITVTGPDGANHSQGPATVLDATVHQPLGSLPNGAYQVAWHVLAADGDPEDGQFGFTVDLPAPSASPVAPTPSSSSSAATSATGRPVGLIVLGVLVLVVAGVGLAAAGRRRRS